MQKTDSFSHFQNYALRFWSISFFVWKAEKELELQLFKLYHNEQAIDELNEDLSARQRAQQKEEKKAGRIEDEIKDKKKEQGTLVRQLGKIDQQIKEAVSEEND